LFAVPVEERLRLRAEENRRRARDEWLKANGGGAIS
jgi:hypothetical protein